MVVLLDTHVLLWTLDAPARLPKDVVTQLESPQTTVYFSAASIWEIAIKSSLGKVDFRYSPEDIAQAARDTGFAELSVSAAHGAKVAQLPLHHRDPFDRLLIAQTLLLPAQLITADVALVPYSELVHLVK
ncbi:MAG: type II toxin-antitoxin system VapC family toxin [Thiobacillus sp.]